MIDTIHGAKASAIIYPIDFAMMSDGAKRVFMILTRIILANVSLIAIEEPENSVHPSLFQAYIQIMHKCLYFYHIETYLRDNTPCNIEDVKLDDMITFRVLENKRSLLKNNTECCEKIKPDQLVRTMPIVTMSSSTMEVTLGDEKKICSLYALKQVNGEVEFELCGRHFKVAVLSGSIREILK